MPEFLDLTPASIALQLIKDALQVTATEERILTQDALGRISARSINAPHALPPFTRSSVDGYAVKATDTYGASDSLPAYLNLVGEVLMGTVPEFTLKQGECCLIHTGGMIPGGADAVLMLENAQVTREVEVEVYRSIAFGENLINEGEDVQAFEEVVEAGTRLRPAEIGGLMSLGITEIEVRRKLRVAIISSGDEIISPESPILPGKVRDANSYSLSALIAGAAGIAVRYGIIPDDEEALFQAASKAVAECDMLVITAGSSASARDFTSTAINRLGKPGVLVHGLNIRPGKPTIMAVCEGKPVVGLPGNPVSALVIARLYVLPIMYVLGGLRENEIQPYVSAILSLNISSQTGREDWFPVRLKRVETGFIAEPVFGKSNLIFTLARSDGMLRIPADTTGLSAGEEVKVYLL